MHRVVFLFFLLSGFTSLVFEVLWERMLMQVFGSTTFAVSTLLTAFMAGLALGSAIGGRLSARAERPLLVYGLLEGGVGLYALLVPLMLDGLPTLYGLIFDRFLEDFYLFSLLRFAAVFAILLVPTTMMGATLPLVSQWIARHERAYQGSVGLLYGMNTLGACAGCFLAGFVLLPSLGLSQTNAIFAATNVALCLLVWGTSSTSLKRLEERSRSEEVIRARRERADALEQLGLIVTPPDLGASQARRVLAAFALFGALSMAYQVLWTRAYVIVLGSSTYSFTVILVSFLIGLSAGSALISLGLERISRPVYWLGLSQLGLAAFATLTFFVLDGLPELLFHRLRQQVSTADEIYLYSFLLVGALVFVPTLLQGMSFPLVVRALAREQREAGKSVGRLYAFNTLGAIAGSFLAGFVLLPGLGLGASIATVIGLSVSGAAALTAHDLWTHRRDTARRAPWRVVLLALGLLAAGGVALAAPPIDRIKLTRGLFRAYWAREMFDEQMLERDRPELLYYKDGVNVTTSVERRARSVTLKANGKAEASDGDDMATQILVGLTPFIFYSERPGVEIGSEVAVMIGYGSGVTAGGSLQWPLKRLEVIEIEEAMIEASRFFNHVNHEPLSDPRTELIISDGRNYLEYNEARYDVIVSEPSNPWIAGVASLFTVEHFERARRHLKPGGIFSQWVQIYELDAQNVRAIFATFARAFPHVQVFLSKSKGTDLILLGSDSPLPMPADGFERAMALEPVRRELERAGLSDMYDFYGLMFMDQEEFLEFGRGAPLNTDDNGYLEFAAPKNLVRYDIGQSFFTERYHSRDDYGDPRQALEAWGDQQKWSEARVARLARGVYRAGKSSLSRQLLEDHFGAEGMSAARDRIAMPLDELDRILLVHHVESLDIHEAMVRLWPVPELKALVIESALHDKATQATHYLEGERPPTRSGYAGAQGLLYAYLLGERGYWKFALRQLERLKEEGDEAIVEGALYHILYARTAAKRLRYDEAYDAYIKAGLKLLD